MNSHIKFGLLALLMFFMLISAISCFSDEKEEVQFPQAGSIAPNFELESVEGEIVSLGELKGTPVLLVFWTAT